MGTSSVNGPFCIAMVNNQRVYIYIWYYAALHLVILKVARQPFEPLPSTHSWRFNKNHSIDPPFTEVYARVSENIPQKSPNCQSLLSFSPMKHIHIFGIHHISRHIQNQRPVLRTQRLSPMLLGTSIGMMAPKHGWLIIEHPIKMGDLDVPPFKETSISIKLPKWSPKSNACHPENGAVAPFQTHPKILATLQ